MNHVSGIAGGRVLLPDGKLVHADVSLDGDKIRSVGEAIPARSLDATSLLVLPGIVDIHGDAFERQLAPRPETLFPLDLAMADTDRQLLSNGITTAFHGITCSWEGGLRGVDTARSIVTHLLEARVHGHLAADNRIHLRFENHNLDAVDEVSRWLGDGWVDFLAFNDHLPAIARMVDDGARIGKYAERAGVSVERFREIVLRTRQRGCEVQAAVRRLAVTASRWRVPMASHDDFTAEDRLRYQELDCRISEFPMRREAAIAACELGNAVVMGAPNVVRGGSHIKGVGASDMVGEGVCTVLASDYFYPALLSAPFRLAESGVVTFGAAWALVSRNPALAAGLDDRGEIRVGRRADLILVDASLPALPRVVATIAAGQMRHAARHLPVH